MSHDHSNPTNGPLPGDVEDPHPMPMWMICGMSVALMIVTVLAVAAMYYGAVFRETNGKLISVRSEAAQVMREARTLATMQEPHWETFTDADGELVGEKTLKIPVGQAAELIIERYGSNAGGGN
jgi:hypothetical protein